MTASTPETPAATAARPDGGSLLVAADHAGVELKRAVIDHLRQRGVDVRDLGPHDETSVDYPDYAHTLAGALHQGEAGRGVLICGTGVGMAMSANRWPGVRAVNCSDVYTCKMARLHNDANLLTLGARVVGLGLALELVDTFLDQPFEGGRHQRRVGKIDRAD
ncbi:MAG: ribose 5-phosphate isomerase B [Acidobacteria bacterium]|nr:MAG: ribose 5-phosphate isomerase B [Acidobacteriota bacterium]